jgi:hypothetical protein
MTREEHAARHVELHRALDELLADFVDHHLSKVPYKGLDDTNLLELMEWSHRQTTDPDEGASSRRHPLR